MSRERVLFGKVEGLFVGPSPARPLGEVSQDITRLTRSLEDPSARIAGAPLVETLGGLKPLKIYILIRDSIDVGHAVNCAAHASLALYLRHQDDPVVQDWVKNSFRKVTCKVTDAEFEHAKTFGDCELITESKLPQPEVALAFKPQRDWDPFFKTLKLYSL